MESDDKAKVVMLQVIMPDSIPATALLGIFNEAFQRYIKHYELNVSPLDWNVSILGKHGLRRESVE